MLKIEFTTGDLEPRKHNELKTGFESHSRMQEAPPYDKSRLNWTILDEQDHLIAALTADLLWQWLYIDELWVDERYRGHGMGKQLMEKAQEFAKSHNLSGLWLWTQSWQAPRFYQSLGFEEFTRLDNFPPGHSRIGFRKLLSENGQK